MDKRYDGHPCSSSANATNAPVTIIVNHVMKLKEALKCGICHSTVKSHILTSCNHLFCEVCFRELRKKATKDRKDLCPICSQMIKRRSCGNSKFVEDLIRTYLKLAKTVTTEMFTFDLPPQERFYESQAVMTQLPQVVPRVAMQRFKAPKVPAACSDRLPFYPLLRTSRLARQSQDTNRFRRPNLQGPSWRFQNQSQVIEEEEDEEVGDGEAGEQQPLETKADQDNGILFVSPLVLKLKRGSSVTRDPETKKVKWDECQLRISNRESLEAIPEELVTKDLMKIQPAFGEPEIPPDQPDDKEPVAEAVLLEKIEPIANLSDVDVPEKVDVELSYPNSIVPGIVKTAEIRQDSKLSDDVVADSFAEEDNGADLAVPVDNNEKENISPSFHSQTRLVILASQNSSKKDTNLLNQFADTFKGVSIVETCSQDVTHLVVFKTCRKVCKKLSVKYCYALSLGLPIVTSNWMVNSISKNKLLDTRSYEVDGVENKPNGAKACRRSMQDVGRTLLKNYTFFVPLPFFQSRIMKRDILIEMIIACGGKVVKNPWDLRDASRNNFIVYGTHMEDLVDTADTARRFEMTNDAIVVFADWVIDSICNYRVEPELNKYRPVASAGLL